MVNNVSFITEISDHYDFFFRLHYFQLTLCEKIHLCSISTYIEVVRQTLAYKENSNMSRRISIISVLKLSIFLSHQTSHVIFVVYQGILNDVNKESENLSIKYSNEILKIDFKRNKNERLLPSLNLS